MARPLRIEYPRAAYHDKGSNYRLDQVWVRGLPEAPFSGRRPFDSAATAPPASNFSISTFQPGFQFSALVPSSCPP